MLVRTEYARKQTYTVFFEMSVLDAVEGKVDLGDVSKRLEQFSPEAKNAGALTSQTTDYGKGWPVIVTAEPLLVRKPLLFPHSVFVVELDAALGLIDPKQYDGSRDRMVQGK